MQTGSDAIKRTTSLFRLRNGQHGRICGIAGGVRLRQSLNQVGIHLGDTFVVLRGAYLGGPMLIQINAAQIALGRGMAEKIMVQSLSNSNPDIR